MEVFTHAVKYATRLHELGDRRLLVGWDDSSGATLEPLLHNNKVHCSTPQFRGSRTQRIRPRRTLDESDACPPARSRSLTSSILRGRWQFPSPPHLFLSHTRARTCHRDRRHSPESPRRQRSQSTTALMRTTCIASPTTSLPSGHGGEGKRPRSVEVGVTRRPTPTTYLTSAADQGVNAAERGLLTSRNAGGTRTGLCSGQRSLAAGEHPRGRS